MSRITLILFLALILHNPDLQENPQHTFTIYKEDGITVAQTGGGPKYTEPLFEYEEILRLKQDTSNEESILFRPRHFTRGPDGNYYLVDAGNHRIAVFDEYGTYQRSFGSEGEGPGTFRTMSLQCLHDGVLHVLDIQMRRTSLFRLDGSLIDVLIRPRPGFYDVPRRYRLADDRQLLIGTVMQMEEDSDLQQAAATIVNADFDTLQHVTTDFVRIAIRTDIPGEPGVRNGVFVHFPGYPCADFSPRQGVLLTDGHSPKIDRYDSTGALVGRIVLNVPPKTLPSEERRLIISRADRRVREFSGAMKEAARARRNLLTFAEPMGFWMQMAIDDAGYIWLSVVENEFRTLEGVRGTICDLLSPEGEYLGRTRLPGQFDDCVIVDGCLCANLQDEETGEYLPTVFRIRPLIKGFRYPN